jgi:predicted phosphodiesterase
MRDEITAIVRQLVAKHHDKPARSIARLVVAETNGALTLEQARRRVRSAFGQGGKADRRFASSPRPARKPGQGVPMPLSKAEPWNPFVFDVVGRVGILSDVHIPYHSETALGAAVGYLQKVGIDGLVLNGDMLDFYAISRFVKNPRLRNFAAELAAGRHFLGWIRDQFPEIPIVFKLGNHEERWRAYLWQHAIEISEEPEMGLAAWMHLDRHKMQIVEDKRPIMVGKLPVLHGHEKGAGITAPVNQARGAFLRLHHTVLEGHGHRTSAHCEPDMFGREVFCWSTGCLADLRPEYARFAKYNHGFALVTVQPGGDFDVQNLRITADGTVRQS